MLIMKSVIIKFTETNEQAKTDAGLSIQLFTFDTNNKCIDGLKFLQSQQRKQW